MHSEGYSSWVSLCVLVPKLAILFVLKLIQHTYQKDYKYRLQIQIGLLISLVLYCFQLLTKHTLTCDFSSNAHHVFADTQYMKDIKGRQS